MVSNVSALNTCVVFPAGNTGRANATLRKWNALGYWSIVLIDKGQDHPQSQFIEVDDYPGFSTAANMLCQLAVKLGADFVVVGGDDIDPDANLWSWWIAKKYADHFGGTYGVVQPMGDKYGALADGAERAAVSPWIGRQFIQQAYGGLGPYWTGYKHLFADAELWCAAESLGVLFQDPDVSQYHAHWGRGHEDTLPKEKRARIVSSLEADKRLFRTRKARGFPGL